jgi:hypothetical protein
MSKADYVRSQGQTRDHHCHWPGCTRQVPPAMWGCKAHWFKLPKALRDKIWRTYKPGQEISQTPSRAYVEAAPRCRPGSSNTAAGRSRRPSRSCCDGARPAQEAAGPEQA